MNAKRKDLPLTFPDDAPEITPEWIQEADLHNGQRLVRRGRPQTGNAKQLLSLRLPVEVIQLWKSSGPGWQTRMADTLQMAAPKVNSAG